MADSTPTPVQRPLTALVPVLADKVKELRALTTDGTLNDNGLLEVGTVHFARIFVVAEDNAAGLPPNTVAVITSYDGDFATYINAFVANDSVAGIFNVLLSFADDPEAKTIIPVQKNAAKFANWVKKYDITFTTDTADPTWGFWFSAYPDKTVKQIQAS